jgi:hypothetical protein
VSAPARYATTRKVSIAWLLSLGLAAAAELPTDISTWAGTGFITPAASGGSPGIHVPVAHPIISLQCWAVDPDTDVPPWNLAGDLAEAVRAGGFSHGTQVQLALADSDQNARVLSAYVISEPRPSYGDMGDYACMKVDLALHWAVSA